MCNTDLKIRRINKEIEIHRLEGLILGVEKRIISLNGRICDLAKADNGDPVEMARLKRNLAHAELDVANYELSIAQAKADMNSLMQEAGRDAGERMAAQLGPLFETLFGGASEEEDVDRASMGFGGLGDLLAKGGLMVDIMSGFGPAPTPEDIGKMFADARG